jgi:hypothetical protein
VLYPDFLLYFAEAQTVLEQTKHQVVEVLKVELEEAVVAKAVLQVAEPHVTQVAMVVSDLFT